MAPTRSSSPAVPMRSTGPSSHWLRHHRVPCCLRAGGRQDQRHYRPCFEVGESASLYQFPGTIKIMPDTYYRVMEDIIDSLAHWGFKNFMFINMHAGNVPIISQLPGRSSASTASSAIRWTGGALSSPTPRTSARIRAGVPTAMPVRAAPA